MTTKRDRFFALTMALLFLVTASALTIAVIYTAVSDSRKNKNTAAPNTSTAKKNSLAGTQLKGFTPVATVTELQRIDTKPGTGKEAKATDTVTVDYTGAIAATGIIFQSSLDSGQPVSFGLDKVIKGWADGVPGMKEGGTRRLLIPADLAYGSNPPANSNIPPNAPLVFDITLLKIGQ